MTQPDTFDIAIIGGGMVGASLALLMAQEQPTWRIALLDAQPFAQTTEPQYQPSFDARSTALAAGSVEILRELGLWQTVAQHATAIAQVHVSDAGHFMGGKLAASDYALDALGYVVPNAWMGRVLLAKVQAHASIHCIAPVRVEKLIPQALGAKLQLARGDEIFFLNCKLAVVADGGSSLIRQSLGISTSTKPYGQTAIIANVSYTEPHQGIAYERFTPQGPLALLPLGESSRANQSALVLTLPTAQADEISQSDDAEFLNYLQQQFGFRLGKFLRVGVRHQYPLALTTADEQIRSHLVLMGNAAHFLHPVAGQGFNLSLRDCVCLVSALSKGLTAGKPLGDLSILQTYLQKQAIDQTLTVEFSDKLVRIFSSTSLPLIALRHLGFLGLEIMPAIKTQFAAQTMGVAGVKY